MPSNKILNAYVDPKSIKNLLKQLGDFSNKNLASAVRRAIVETQKVVSEDAMHMAPMDTGNLALQVNSDAKPKTKKKVTRGYVFSGSRADLGIPDDAKHFWPAAVEFGARPHAIPMGWENGKAGAILNHPGMKAQPYLRPALLKNQKTYLYNLKKEVVKGIDRAERKASRAILKDLGL